MADEPLHCRVEIPKGARNQYAFDPGFLQHIGDHFSRNRNPRRTRTTILACITEIRDCGGDAATAGPRDTSVSRGLSRASTLIVRASSLGHVG